MPYSIVECSGHRFRVLPTMALAGSKERLCEGAIAWQDNRIKERLG